MADAEDLSGQHEILRLTSGPWMSKTLTAAHEIRLFDLLTERPGSQTTELAPPLGLAERPTRSLLTACTALSLLITPNQPERNR